MNHAAVRLARAGRAAMLVAAALLAIAAASLPAQAQTGTGDLPGASPLDPSIDPFPFDGRLAIRDYLRRALPSRWWANEPDFSLGVWSAMVHVPDDWKGNPTSALIGLCPPRESVLWRHIDRLDLVPFYRDARRAGTTCRP
ncbi:hypothetical protein AncyloWKF20_07775 [Ancylobacter sp. WKF20]|uniref:hypothetical protein n=1 Tax=Ancylobacter sp. WKF20 TaxID=3039801 RepID=UPI00243446D6|nr:hypothetical protein [Ancylobacter sp. WKF20]WGD31708.1 hypothetical protein AncyloWKF20_07775 [Ancylobacter sp. WKF20]